MEEGFITKSSQWMKAHAQITAAFFVALIFGLVCHGMGLFNKYSTHDDIMALFSVGTTISSGRWMLHILDWLETMVFGDGHFSLPLTHGLFSILCAAISVCLLVDLLKIRSHVLCAGLGGLTVAFPAITGLFGYMYTMPYYLLAMLMMTISACLICRNTHWTVKLLAVLLGGCSVGIYQAFLPLLLSIPLLYDLSVLFRENGNLKAFFKAAGIQVLCILGVMAFYFAVNRFFLAKFHLELNNYMGINQMESTTLAEYLNRAGRAYAEFFWPERNVAADIFPMHLFYVSRIMVIADVLLAVRLTVYKWKKEKIRALILVLLLALAPLAFNFIYVMSEKVHGLMTYGQIMQAALFVWLVDMLEIRLETLRRALSGLAAVLLALSCVMYARYDNQCYLKTAFQQQQAISWVTTLAAQIKAAEGYRDDLPVVFLNQEKISDPTLYNIDELNFILLAPYSGNIWEYLNSYALRYFMERWCGFGPAYADAAVWAGLPEIPEMPHYPDDGSIRNLGDVLVVNF